MRRLICSLCLLCLLIPAAPALAATPFACGLVAQAEASAAMGLPLEPGKPTGPNPMGQTLCFFGVVGPRPNRYVQITLTLPPPKLRKNLPASRLFADAQARDDGDRPISGMGDQAFWGGSGAKMGAGLHVLSGEYYLIVDVNSGDPDKDLAVAQKLAAIALGRLK